MELREYRTSRPMDFSTDCATQGGESENLGVRTTSFSSRALLCVSLVVALLLPVPVAIAAEEGTTTTVPEPTTTTLPPESTTTTIEVTTTTTVGSSTTTVEEGTSTTVAEGEPGESDDPRVGEDPLDEDPLGGPNSVDAVELPLPSIRFPVVGRSSYRSTYGQPRDGGARLHKGTDIIAGRGTPIVAVASGRVVRLGIGEDAGQFVVVRHNNGWSSVYAHLNNDSPGTDNGLAMGYGPGIEIGARVRAGTLLGYVGDSGNAEDTTPHLHFELHQPDGFRPDPYPALRSASRVRNPSTLATVNYRDLQLSNASLLGHLDPGTGFNAGLAVVGHHAFVGTWGNAERCPGTGVRIIDLGDPSEPTQLGVFADHTEFPGTATPALWIGEVKNDAYAGTIGIVALADCNNPLTETDPHFVGFAVYALDDPADPRLIAVHETGGNGVADLAVSRSDDGLMVAAVVPMVRANTPGVHESIALFDATDPLVWTAISNWHPDPISGSFGPADDPASLLSGSSVEWDGGDTIHASLRSFGDVVIDVSDPAEPIDVSPPVVPAWTLPTELSEEDVVAGHGYYGVNTRVDLGSIGTLEARLSEGAILTDGPSELASLIPAPAFDPQRWWVDPNGEVEFPLVWDVVAHDRLVLVTDHHSGLWIFELAEILTEGSMRSEID